MVVFMFSNMIVKQRANLTIKASQGLIKYA